MSYILHILFITYVLHLTNGNKSGLHKSESEITEHKLKSSKEQKDTSIEEDQKILRPKFKGRRRKSEPDRSENEIDLQHANFDDSELVADLNSNIIFDREKHMKLIQGDILIDSRIKLTKHEHVRYIRGAVKPVDKLWPGGKIYYKFMSDLGQIKVQLVKSAMQHIMDFTCVKFIERTNDQKDYLNITSEKGCYSWVGKIDGPQELSVGSGCVTMGIIAHELAHAMGFYHEQSRPDRDNYVELIKENIKEKQLDNFKKRLANEVDSLNVPYDYGSIMHYGLKDFSANKSPTLRTLKEVPSGTEIGQRVRLSDQDIKQANLLYKCPTTARKEPENSRTNRNSGDLEALMIVGGSQDTTEPLCIDGMTYRGNQVLVTMCSLGKSSLKWSWTDEYQLKNNGNTLCLSGEDNHTVGGNEDVPIKMEACDPMDDKQKWICTGGFLKNLALNKCINAAWKPYKRNFMIALSTCDNNDINQMISVFGMGKRYEPLCRRWNMGLQLQCNQQYPRKTYLGCSQNHETMIGYEKVGRGNNLRAIKSIECCQLLNSTGNVYRKTMRTINKTGVTECPDGFFVQGIRLSNIEQEKTLKALSYLICIKPSDTLNYENCYWDELRSQKNNKGMNVCSRGGFYMTGIFKKRCSRLSCINKFKCCSIDLHQNYT